MWFLMDIDTGMALSYLEAVLSNVLTGIMMTDVTTPSKLI